MTGALAQLSTWMGSDLALPVGALLFAPVALLLCTVVLRSASRRARRISKSAMGDVDSLLVASLDLRGVADVADAGDRSCRLATELLRGTGALLYVKGPGRLILAGRHGDHPEPMNPEVGRDPGIEQVLRTGAVDRGGRGTPVLVPVTGTAGVVGVVAVAGTRRQVDDLTAGVVQLLGSQIGAMFDRLNGIESLLDAATRDPITGVGNRQQATALIASLAPGDGLLILDIDGLDLMRRVEGDAPADVVLGQVGLHLRNGTRNGDAIARYGDTQFVVALRNLKAPIEMVVHRLVDSWMASSPTRTLSVGGALHLDGDAPLDTLGRSEFALESAKRGGGGHGHVAPNVAPNLSTVLA